MTARDGSAASRARIEVTRLGSDDIGPTVDEVAVEDPLTIQVRGRDGLRQTFAVTMRTPGDDLALAAGLCLGEGLVTGPHDLLDVQRCDDLVPGTDGDVVLVTLDRPTADLDGLHRHGVMTSACGVCGRTQVDEVAGRSRVAPAVRHLVDEAGLLALPATLRASQDVFATTGGLHAAMLVGPQGAPVDLREDVGRHNAVDKVIGRALRANALPLDEHVLVLSGRASWELVAKAAVSGVPVVAALGAPSSLAVDLAQRCGITLAGFLRSDRGNLYAHPGRVRLSSSALAAVGS